MECSGASYLVVYLKNGDIYGQRMELDGALLGSSFEIYHGDNASSEPDAACLFYDSTLVVVWAYDYHGDGSDMDMYAQAVHASHQTSGSQLIGSPITVAVSSVRETHPAIACNELDSTCLVAFDYEVNTGVDDIRGQRLTIVANDLAFDGDPFAISDTIFDESFPDVAWGSQSDEFLVVWQHWYNGASSSYYRIRYVQVHDTEQGTAANELIGAPDWLIAIGTYYGDYDRMQEYPAIAYNHSTQHYLVSFLRGDDSVHAVFLTPGAILGDPLYINNYASGRLAVAYSGISPDSLAAADEFNVVYIRNHVVNEHAVFSDLLPDQTFPTDLVVVTALDEISDSAGGFYNPDVSGSWYNGTYLAVWEELNTGTGDYNIYARRVGNYYQVMLPLVVR